MKVPVPDEILPADQLGRVHFIGVGGAGLSAHRPDHGRARGRGDRQRRPGHAVPPGAARARGALPPRLRRRRTSRDADTVVVTTAAREDNPEVRRGPAPRPAGAAALGRPAGGDDRPPRRRGRRHPRQDHDHLAAHQSRCSPAAPTRRTPSAGCSPRPGATPTRGRASSSSPRPTRATAPSSSTRPHAAVVTNVEADHLDVWGTEEAYRQPPSPSSSTGSTRPGFVVCCIDDAGAAGLARLARERGLRSSRWASPPTPTSARPTSLRGHHLARSPCPGPARLGRVTLQIPGRHYVARRAGRAGGRAAARPALRRPPRRPGGLHRLAPPAWSQGRGRRRPGLRQLRPPPRRDRR